METIYPANCGLVIAAPYLPRLFSVLDLTEHARFRDEASALRAVFLLQYLADGAGDSPWQALALNRILCNVRPGKIPDQAFSPTPREIRVIDGLIQGMITNWKAVGNTSVEGFRESFLMRSGILTLEQDGCWHLNVEPRPFDMLLDAVPWSFSTVKLSWMDRLIHVNWR